MNCWLTIVIVALFQASLTLALGKPGQSDVTAIRSILDDIQKTNSDIDADKRNIAHAKSAEDARELQSDLESLKQKRIAQYNRAIWLTIIAYDIYPGCTYSLASGVEVSRSVKQGQTVEWLPYFSDHEPIIQIGPEGHPISPIPTRMATAAAITASDGTSRIYPEALGDPPSPGELAAALVHEKTHFDIDTTPGRGDVLNHPEGEAAAYQSQLDAMKAGIITIDPKRAARYKAFLSDRLDFYTAKGKEERQRLARNPTVIVQNEEDLRLSDVMPHTNEELAAIKRNAIALRTQVYVERGSRLAREDFERQMQERNAELDRKRVMDDINSRRVAEQAMAEAQRNILRRRADAAFQTMKHDAQRMQGIVAKLCNGDDPVLPGDGNPTLRAEASNFAYYREEFVQTGERADLLPASVPFSRDWVYWGLDGCERDTMRALFTKDPPLAVRANPEDEAWLLQVALSVRPKVDAPVPGGRPPVDDSQSGSSRDDDRGSRVPGSVQGPAWDQLNSWPHF